MRFRYSKRIIRGNRRWFALSILLLAACVPGTPQPASPAPTESPLPATTVPAETAPATEAPVTQTPIPPTDTAAAVPTDTEIVETVIPTRILRMIDEQAGWGTTESEIVRTADGGASWQRVSPASMASNPSAPGAFFLDAEHAWALQPDPADFYRGTLYRSADAGNAWEPIDVPFGGGSLVFQDEMQGWMLAARGAAMSSSETDLYRTADGGATWQLVYDMDPTQPQDESDLPFSGSKNGLAFLNEQAGWVAGSVPQPGFIWLYKTGDGGQTWQLQDLPFPNGIEDAQTNAFAPRFFNEQSGLLTVQFFGDMIYTVIYRTEDGGESWTAGTPAPLAGEVDLISLQDVVIWNGGPSLLWSHDAGQTWEERPTNLDLTPVLANFDFATPATGWALTGDAEGNHALYKTTDGGATWMQP